jgi:carbonic anhydrase/acetyltransferase-like protein (isoleucine patch superfamily)
LVGQGSVVEGSAARFRAFATSGVLVGSGATVEGTAERTGQPVTHDTEGTLAGAGAVVTGVAARIAAPVSHATSGDLVGAGAVISGDASVPSTQTIGGGGVVRSRKKPAEEKPIVYPEKHPWIHFPDVVGDITPELADAVIEAVETAVESRTVQDKDLETAKAEKALRTYLKAQEQRWKKEYAQLILLEYERREQEYEDAQIAMMLFEM